MENSDIWDKYGNPIHKADYVFTRIRGGSHEGKVEEIITDDNRAAELSLKHPPKILFQNKDGKKVAHNPGALEIKMGTFEETM
ncbi:hypothetical protein N7462_009198 [Penicillium macrosclerotiorum]|uniref:uncharacterized protein n=1 Tax=Penicillium macrosclerotiorum TaxID=303699 RepID=UPI00254715DD|nr:uncharacterized protein N7462_009198 [Penicillium macrosclerotiorum]KAJ5673759.1 hypothetical protein N7462_009198 [Penicillium macrosclerotiorum]